ncbi:MAG TPA: outer membrane beta-barrel protein [Puia sp.]|nr:outer membrane beta-barrel protein [Puia sp.]
MKRGVIIPYLYSGCLSAILPFLLVCYSFIGYGQSPGPPVSETIAIKGRVRDTALNKDCPLAVIAVLQPDSTLLEFTRSRKDGSFSFHGLPAGQYRILVSHPSYSEYSRILTVSDHTVTDLGTLALSPKADTLTAVVVTPKTVPPRMNGDTLEYNTAHMKLKVNANVEELLARLPGVQIDQNGGITVNGQKVQRLLVDGEDLFGGDPTIVTRNFNADMIAKVQLLDKKSAQTEFTGIDDGQRTKTLNLSLKEDSKRGYFVKLEAGGDPQGYYNANGLLGSFKRRRQFAALGMVANNGNTGFSGAMGDLGAGLNVGGGTNDALGASAGGGIPQVIGGGMHYADKWNGNEDHLVGNYQYGRLVTHPVSSSRTEQVLSDSIYIQNQQSSSANNQVQHGLNADYDYIPDSLSAFRFSLGGVDMQGHNEFTATGNSLFNDTLVNDSYRKIHDDVTTQNFRGSIMWRIRARKKAGRNFSILAGMAEQDNTTKGYLYSLNNFYHPDGTLQSADTVDQRKVITTNGLFVNSSINYTEPLWKNAVLGFSYGLSFNKSQSLQSTYNKGDGKYEDYIDSLSNHYQNNVLTQRATLNLQVNDKLFGYTIGGDILHYSYRQMDLLKDSLLKYQYLNFAPRINARYNINPYTGFSFDYGGNTQQPSITQLQPVQNNNDPLHVVLGNPDLHPSFSHHFGLGFHNLRPLVINLGLNYGFTTNSISTKTYTDTLGRQISQAVNVSGSNNAGLYFSINKKIKPVDLDLGFNTNLSYGRSVNYIGQDLSNNDNYNVGGGLSLSKYVAEKYSFSVNSNVNYSYSRSSINTGVLTQYWTQSQNAQFSVFPIRDFEINTNAYYNWRQKTSVFDQNNSTFLWNAFINRNFFSNRLALRWQVNNILNQNAGISRSDYINTHSESNFNVIGRYWMLTATYRFMNHGKLK